MAAVGNESVANQTTSMKITNITSNTQYFAGGANVPTAGKGISLSAGSTGHIDDNADALKKALNYAQTGLVTLVKGPLASTIAQPADVPNAITITLNAPVTSNTVTVGGVVFTIGTNWTIGAGTGNGVAYNTAVSLKTAINANATLAAAGYQAQDVILQGTNGVLVIVNSVILPVVTNPTATRVVVSTATAARVQSANRFSLVAVTVPAAATSLTVPTGLSVVALAMIQVRTAAGLTKAFDGSVLYNTNGSLAAPSGAVLLTGGTSGILAATDVVTVYAYGF